MRCECEVRMGRCEGGSPVGGVGERECVGVVSERRGDPASLVMRGCQYLLSLTPLGSSVLEPHLKQQ